MLILLTNMSKCAIEKKLIPQKFKSSANLCRYQYGIKKLLK